MIPEKEGNIQALLGGVPLKARVQHPSVKVRTDRPGNPWIFRYWQDVLQPDGSVKTLRRYHEIGPSIGPDKLSRKQAEIERDKILAPLNKAMPEAMVGEGMVLLGKFIEKFKTAHVNAEAGGRHCLKKPTREKYNLFLDQRIVPKWGEKRLCEIKPDEVQTWLFETCDSWWMMHDIKGLMSTIYAKAEEWGYWPDSRRTPISRVSIGRKWTVRPQRILSPDQTASVLTRLDDPNLLICETCLDTSTRISEVTGLRLKHLDLDRGCIVVEQRNWRGDIDDPKSESSRRVLALGKLAARYKAWIAKRKITEPEAWVFPQRGDNTQPVWDSGVRQALKKAAEQEGCDFPGFGPHSLRRANITWRQEVGASSIEAARIAGHSKVKMTAEYTLVQLKRQQELTHRIQNLRAAKPKSKKADPNLTPTSEEPAA